MTVDITAGPADRPTTPPYARTPEQIAMRAAVHDYLAEQWPMGVLREAVESGRPVTAALARERDTVGLTGLLVPERYGGAGCGYVELGELFEEFGYALYPGPSLSVMAQAIPALLRCATESDRDELLPQVADGSWSPTVALFEPGRGWNADRPDTSASRTGDGWHLDGVKAHVLDAATADGYLVTARSGGDDIGLYLVPAGATGVRVDPLDSIDPSRPLAHMSFDAAPARQLCPDVSGDLESLLDVMRVALACEQVGAARRCLDMSIAYAKIRTQFDRPIGSFQAVKHRCADMHVEVENAQAAADYAAWCLQSERAETASAVAVAKAIASDALTFVSSSAIQVHGGMGFTWECDLHFYFKRSVASAAYLGDSRYHYRRLAQLIGTAP